ncbi:ADP-ribosylglycohydrolase family protein [Longispora sp. NPDC051575]|uniref:ADP-ribosylglycohydrolase family protein n=1 Tax=Longispora sp. NPDC051575 TaxID=3154943 RepID=UPI003419E5A3
MTTAASDAARHSLRGLALGDSFGETWFFRPAADLDRQLRDRVLAPAPWPWTDDTAMAVKVHGMLVSHGGIVPDLLATRFADRYRADPYRNYGAGMHDVLAAIADGEPWTEVTGRQFDGQGSWGNGAAMRVAPLGAWFADDLDRVAEQARLSATVTHAHPEAAAGAVAVAIAAALSTRGVDADELIAATAARTPASDVAARLRRAGELPFSAEPRSVAAVVGCGALISAPDTVPYAIWCAARHLDDLPEALWATVSAGGDMDTTCAIVGGIVAARVGLGQVPGAWLTAAEPLP